MSSPPDSRPRRRGVALISALMVMVIIVIISSAFVTMTASDVRSSQTSGDSFVTLYLAEAGVEYALWMLKHNMLVYPPANYLYFKNGNGTVIGDDESALRGQEVSILQPTSGNTNGQEHVVINDLAYDGGSNFMASGRYCGTFQVYMTQATGATGTRTLTIVSTGRVREVPANWNWTTQTLTATELTSTAFSNIRGQRTINVAVDLDPRQSNVNAAFIKKMMENKWYEKFR